jgi:hypothetical protein
LREIKDQKRRWGGDDGGEKLRPEWNRWYIKKKIKQ